LFSFIEKNALSYFPILSEFTQKNLQASLSVLLFVALSEAFVSYFTVRKFLARGI